jgi:hypothetical protein
MNMRTARVCRWTANILFAGALLFVRPLTAAAQLEACSDVEATDGGGQEVLQSLYIPPLSHAPFSLTLHTEWARPINGGGTFTIVNTRPIKRDSAGRIYQERWLLVPKRGDIRSRMSWIQIADPLARTLLECNVPKRVCELEDWKEANTVHMPISFRSGPLPNGKGVQEHEDLGTGNLLGIPVHGYREVVKFEPWAYGNDRPMTTMREIRYAEKLGIDLSSILDAPRLGRQTFTVTEITTNEPDARDFQPPPGYKVVDKRNRKSGDPTK